MNKSINFSAPLFPISVVSKLLNIHQRTLRIYDEENILKPKRTAKNRRMYSYKDIEKAKLIIYLMKNLALNLTGVKIILGLFEEFKINPNEYRKTLHKISAKNKIDEQENIKKTAKRGRKALVKKI